MVTPTLKKRKLEESRARAREFQESLRRKAEAANEHASASSSAVSPSPSSPSASDAGPDSKKAKVKGEAQTETVKVDGKTKEKEEKANALQESRKRAKKWAEHHSNGTNAGEHPTSDNTSESMDLDTSDADMPAPAESKSPSSQAAPRPARSGAAQPPRLQNGKPPPLELDAYPPMPETSTSAAGRRMYQPSTQSLQNGDGRPSAPSRGGQRTGVRPTSFLRHATNHAPNSQSKDVVHMAAASRLSYPLRDSPDDPSVPTAGSGPLSGRPSFLSQAGGVGNRPHASDANANGGTSTVTNSGGETAGLAGQRGDHAASAAAADRNRSGRASGGGPSQRRAKIWAFKCTLALAPVTLFFLALGGMQAWPYVQLAANGAWGAVRGFAGKTPRPEMCFLNQGEEATQEICKGAETADCPVGATCGRGTILQCDLPFEKKGDGTACVLNAEAEEEAKAVVEALRTLTIQELCKGNGLIFRNPEACWKRSMTLSAAATAQNRTSLSLLAAFPAGNVGGLLELEGEPSLEFGGAEDDVGDKAGSGADRKVSLSKSMHDELLLMPSLRCRARLAAGSWLLAYWPYCLGLYALLLIIGCLDIRRLKSYKQRVQVCTMRDECYQTLLDHAAGDSSPMQVSHIQISVGDKRRARREGSQANVQQKVSELWHLVEREVEHDTRIRRNYKNVLGQKNVACWQWVGPAGTSFKSIGALDPGPAPRLWLLRWLNTPRAVS